MTLEFDTVQEAKAFLRDIQVVRGDSLTKLKRQYVGSVRTLANKARASLFSELKNSIEETVRDGLQPELTEEIIEELDDRSVSVETLVLANIRKEVVRTVSTRHTARTAFHAIEESLRSHS